MSDKTKITLAVLSFLSALILPLVGLFVGWWKWDMTTGILFMVGVFMLLSVIGSLFLFRVKELSWSGVFLPHIFGAVYGFLPDAVALSLDDAATSSAGAILSVILAFRKQPDTPKWIFIPLIAAGIYTLFGGALPGPLDEFIVDALALVFAWLGTRQTIVKA